MNPFNRKPGILSQLVRVVALAVTLTSLLVCNPTSVSANIFELANPQNTTKSRSGSLSTRASVGNIVFERLMKKCKNKQKLFLRKNVTQAECEAKCANNAGTVYNSSAITSRSMF